VQRHLLGRRGGTAGAPGYVDDHPPGKPKVPIPLIPIVERGQRRMEVEPLVLDAHEIRGVGAVEALAPGSDANAELLDGRGEARIEQGSDHPELGIAPAGSKAGPRSASSVRMIVLRRRPRVARSPKTAWTARSDVSLRRSASSSARPIWFDQFAAGQRRRVRHLLPGLGTSGNSVDAVVHRFQAARHGRVLQLVSGQGIDGLSAGHEAVLSSGKTSEIGERHGAVDTSPALRDPARNRSG